MTKYNLLLLKYILQERCLETWLMEGSIIIKYDIDVMLSLIVYKKITPSSITELKLLTNFKMQVPNSLHE